MLKKELIRALSFFIQKEAPPTVTLSFILKIVRMKGFGSHADEINC